MTKNKHDHTATKKIKAWLFAIMLLLPFLFLLPTGLYYGLNQNAQLSETITQQPVYYQTNEISSYNDININYIYHWKDNYTASAISNTLYFVDFLGTENIKTEFSQPNTAKGTLYMSQQGVMRIKLVDSNNTALLDTSVIAKPFDFVVSSYLTHFNSIDTYIDYFSASSLQLVESYTPIVDTHDISTSIINAWNSTWQNPLFSWTNYSPFYAPMQSFTNVFGINNMQIANVLTYLATITAIYIVFDIVIELFTYLTHLIPRSD